MTPPPPPSADLLLEHGAFLRRLARSLVRDEQRAEDVVQETYMAALSRPPPPGVRLAAWLGGIARNLSRRTRRTEGRLSQREAKAARPEAAPHDPISERLEIQRLVAEAVARLTEPGRRAIVHRYFDGLSPTAMADAEGVSVRTIESRLRRAREQLRADLDSSYGLRTAWQAALLPVTGWGQGALESAATSSAQASVPTAAGVGTAVAAGVTIMSLKSTLVVVAVCAVGSFFAGRHIAPATPEITDPVTADSEASEDVPMLGTDTAVLAQTRKDLDDALAAHEALLAANKALSARVAELERSAGGTHGGHAGPTAEDAARVFGPKAHRAVLEAQDWAKAGEAVTHLLPLLGTLSSSLTTGKDVDEKGLLDIPKWNGPLQTLAIDLAQKGIPGTGVNGAFTHPAASVNLIEATLEHAKLPLSEAQRERLRDLGDRFIQDDGRRLAAYGDDVLALQKTIDEADLKDRFFADVDALLSKEQVDVLHPPAVKGRLGIDIFSSGVLWHSLGKPMRFKDREDLGRRMAGNLGGELGVGDAERDLVVDATAAWARAFSDEDLAAFADPAYVKSTRLSNGLVPGWAPVGLARRAAANMLALEKALLDVLPPDSSAAKSIRNNGAKYAMPIKR